MVGDVALMTATTMRNSHTMREKYAFAAMIRPA
jgi:hypothetical protein